MSDLNLTGPIELVVLSVKQTATRCRLLGSDRVITLRASGFWDVVPGEIVGVKPRKQWSYAGHPYLSGEIASTRLDAAALGLVPLRLEARGIWDPDEEYWGEEGEPIEDWAKPIIARGPRQEFEMEQVLPGADPDDPDSDPITESNELKDAGDPRNAYKILMELCEADLRCLDAHAHLGNFAFEHRPGEAIRHCEVGLRIGELSLGDDFAGLLPWGHLDNRPFLRCGREKKEARRTARQQRTAEMKQGRDQRWLEGKDFHLADEVRYMQRRAAERSGRIVTIGPLLLFSTDSGDAWILDPADHLASRIAEQGNPAPIHIEETATCFAVGWQGRYEITGAAFVFTDRESGAVTTMLGYPTRRIADQIADVYG